MKRLLLVLALLFASNAEAQTATIAVAGNFTATAKTLSTAFTEDTGHSVRFSFGSTGKLFAQIAKGAPFDAYLAADQLRPTRAVADGFAVQGSQFTYALGRLALYSRRDGLTLGPDALTDDNVRRIALANPATAPYGAAAMQVLSGLGLSDALSDKLVLGDNVAQALQFTVTGNAQLGFVAYSLARARPSGSLWRIPQTEHLPLRQDAVLTLRGAENKAAVAFLDYLKSPAGITLIRADGYGTE